MKKEIVLLFLLFLSFTCVFALPPPPPNPGLPIEEEAIQVEIPKQFVQPVQQPVSLPVEEKPAETIAPTEEVVLDTNSEPELIVQSEVKSSDNTLILLSGVSMIIIMCVVVLLAVKKQKSKSSANKQLAQAVQNPQMVQLRNYVVQSLHQGYSKEQIVGHLLQHGYQKQMIDEVFKYV
jgi:hypothetical protein